MVVWVLTVAQDVRTEFLPRRIARIRGQPKKFDSSQAAIVSSCQPQEGKNEVGQDSQPELRPTGQIEVIRMLKSSLTQVSGDGPGLLFSAKIAEKGFLIRPAVPWSM
jgi:hypothetical protein